MLLWRVSMLEGKGKLGSALLELGGQGPFLAAKTRIKGRGVLSELRDDEVLGGMVVAVGARKEVLNLGSEALAAKMLLKGRLVKLMHLANAPYCTLAPAFD
jgi:hypothetical protein